MSSANGVRPRIKRSKQHRPVLDVIEVVFDAFLDLLVGVGFTAPAVDLRPPGKAGLHPVPGEIAVHRFVVQVGFGLGIDRVRARSDQ